MAGDPTPPGKRGSFLGLRTICPVDGSAVVVQATRSESGTHVAGCSRWKDGFSCQGRCAGQLDLEYSVDLARRVQELFEPPAEFQLEELSVATWMWVCNRVGGDFQVVRADGSILRVVQGDVVGKGMSAALLAAYLVGLYEALAREGLKPSQLLHSMNIALAERTEACPMFATVIALEVDLERRTWTYARAGHELPMMIRAAGLEVVFNDQPSLPIGIDGHEVYYDYEIPLLEGDRLFVGSDGVQEVGLTTDKVLATLRQGLVCDRMHQMVNQLTPQAHRDDITMTIICCDCQPWITAP